MLCGGEQEEPLRTRNPEPPLPGIICVLGMDREKVAAAVAAKREKLLPVLLGLDADGKVDEDKAMGFGHEFLEKFIQVTFTLLEMVEDDREHFLRGIADGIQ